MMDPQFPMKKIIWSIDAFEDKEDLQTKATRVLGAFQNKTFAQIEPVFVLSATEPSGPTDTSTDWVQEFQNNLRAHLEDILLTSDFPHVLSPKILSDPLTSTAAAVETLLDYATKEKADMIIVSSHGRRGLDRLFLGSFAETLLVHAKIPVLVIGANMNVDARFSHILYPTDFGETSRETFRRILSVAEQMKAGVMLYHVVPMPSRIVMDTGYYPAMYGVEGEMVSLDDFLRIQGERQTTRAQEWAEWARAEGVPCTYKVDVASDAIDALICQRALEENCDLIVMEGQSGPWKAALLGSTARNVVRGAPCPTVVIPRASLTEVATSEKESRGYRGSLEERQDLNL